MLPIQHRHIFRSRWVALLWAAGILWFAYDVASSEPADNNESATANGEQVEQVEQVEQALNAF